MKKVTTPSTNQGLSYLPHLEQIGVEQPTFYLLKKEANPPNTIPPKKAFLKVYRKSENRAHSYILLVLLCYDTHPERSRRPGADRHRALVFPLHHPGVEFLIYAIHPGLERSRRRGVVPHVGEDASPPVLALVVEIHHPYNQKSNNEEKRYDEHACLLIGQTPLEICVHYRIST